jgi:transcriptional antiterminator RfaH
MQRWYTVHTKPNTEYQIATVFRYRNIETYLPEIRVPKTQQGRERQPFFPCYLFVKIDFEVVGLSHLQWTPGLRRIIAFNDHPVTLADEAIELIQRRLDGINAAGGQLVLDFLPGDTVQITEGPLQGMEAIFEGPATAAERVQVLLSFLGQVSRARVPVTHLKKIDQATESPVHERVRRTRGRGSRIKNTSEKEL